MFLLKVYRYNKWLFIGMLFFMLGQLVVNYKRGLVFSPWYHYGMFSAKVPVKDTYAVTLVKGANQLPWAPEAWDRVYVTLWQYQNLNENDSIYQKEIKRLFAKAGLSEPDKKYYVQQVSRRSFLNWYTAHLQRSNRFGSLKIELLPVKAIWNGNKLVQKNP